MLNHNKTIYLFLFTILLLIFTIMLPLKDQLFSEDFAYAQSVRHLLITGDLKISERVAPSSIVHILWGAVNTKAFGFSMANLHLSVVILLPFLLFGIFKLYCLSGINRTRSLIFTLFFLSIPWILQLSYTFLTDMTFLTLEVYSLLFYAIGLKKNTAKYLWLGSLFASLAFLTRQLGLALVLAAIITVLLKKGEKKQKVKQFLQVALMPVLIMGSYALWLSLPGNTTIAQDSVAQEYKIVYFHLEPNIVVSNIATVIHRTLNFTSQALALFSPIVFLFVISNSRKTFRLLSINKTKFIVITTIAICIYALDILNFRQGYIFGLPLLIYDYESLPIPWVHIWKFLVLTSLPFLSCAIYMQRKKANKLKPSDQFILFSFLFLAAFTVTTVASWDYYIIPFLPIILLWFAVLTKKLVLNNKLALFLILILLVDSVQMTKLRYSQSGLIWEKAISLVENGVSPLEIDPNNNFGWYYWFYYEKLASDSIEANHGSKKNLSYGFVIKKPDQPRYRFYTDKMIKYTNVDTKNYQIKELPFSSFLVKSKIYSLKLNDK